MMRTSGINVTRLAPLAKCELPSLRLLIDMGHPLRPEVDLNLLLESGLDGREVLARALSESVAHSQRR